MGSSVFPEFFNKRLFINDKLLLRYYNTIFLKFTLLKTVNKYYKDTNHFFARCLSICKYKLCMLYKLCISCTFFMWYKTLRNKTKQRQLNP